MPSANPVQGPNTEPEPLTRLPFKPVTKSHILNCSYHYWHPKYRSSALKSRIISLPPAFLSYLREDGIVLPPSTTPTFPPSSTYNSSASNGWDEDPDPDPSLEFPEIHKQINETIEELGGLVAPKLNWSAPKDATWIAMKKNSMECAIANDVYLLLKSSDFITHDLEHALDDTDASTDASITPDSIPYVLVLRKWFKVNPSCEFRVFVRERRVIGICQRDLNHFAFLFPLLERLREEILVFFEKILKNTFPDADFVFDVYLPEPYDKVRLMDINPWAPRTDPLLFSWLELLTMPLPQPLLGIPSSSEEKIEFPANSSSEESDTQDEDVEEIWRPEMRLVRKDDPEAYSFASTQYSAHKLPKEVVDAGMEGEGGMREFAEQWKRILDGEVEMQRGDGQSESEDEVNV